MNRFAPSLLVLLVALTFWIPGRLSLLRAQHALSDAKARLKDLQNRIAADESRLASAQQERKTQNQARSEASTALAKAQRELAKIDPESQWASPPASLPDWHTDSPYFWTTKESLAGLGLKVFARDGSLTGEIASVLAIDEPTLRKLNEPLARAVADFYSLKRSNARLSDDPVNADRGYKVQARIVEERARMLEALPPEMGSMLSNTLQSDEPFMIRTANGPVVSVEVPATTPEQAARLRDQIGQILEQNLGGQRGRLVTEMGGDWLDEAWGLTGRLGISVTVMRHPDDKYMFGNSYGGFADDMPASDVPQHIPDYLLPFFTDILNPPAAGDPAPDPP